MSVGLSATVTFLDDVLSFDDSQLVRYYCVECLYVVLYLITITERYLGIVVGWFCWYLFVNMISPVNISNADISNGDLGLYSTMLSDCNQRYLQIVLLLRTMSLDCNQRCLWIWLSLVFVLLFVRDSVTRVLAENSISMHYELQRDLFVVEGNLRFSYAVMYTHKSFFDNITNASTFLIRHKRVWHYMSP